MAYNILHKHFFNKRNILRCFSTKPSLLIEKLPERGVMRVFGNEVAQFLQGLVTNDMKHLEEGAGSMYAMFLNIKGRVICDSIIYPSEEKTKYFVECDIDSLPVLKKHLELYKVRRKISIDSLENNYNVWVVCDNNLPRDEEQSTALTFDLKPIQPDILVSSIDPRVPNLGVRIIVPTNIEVDKMLKSCNVDFQEKSFYKSLRYRLGIGEGTAELPPGNCFPLESNADYLHGVSFHKGCYIGQEVTARTHHTGVVRKRLMPLEFDSEVVDTSNDAITSYESRDKVLGKLRGVEKNIGIGLLRVEEVSDINLQVNGIKTTTRKPFWWPALLPKEKQN